jgi:hypothetical protein
VGIGDVRRVSRPQEHLELLQGTSKILLYLERLLLFLSDFFLCSLMCIFGDISSSEYQGQSTGLRRDFPSVFALNLMDFILYFCNVL